MPEFPDITVYAESIERLLAGAVVEKVLLPNVFVLRTVDPPVAALVGKRLRRVERLGKRIVLAFDGENPVGLVNCMEGFSTFACRPLVNVHDVAVVASHRGLRVAEQMLAMAESIAIARGACKLTLEVLQGNVGADRLYRRMGFANYELDPAMGQAQFMQKWLY